MNASTCLILYIGAMRCYFDRRARDKKNKLQFMLTIILTAGSLLNIASNSAFNYTSVSCMKH
jgi:hypothetical protein